MPKFENPEIIAKFNDFLNNTSVRENVINWYDFKPNTSILEIGSDYGQVTNFLVNTGLDVTSIEIDNDKYEYVDSKLSKFKNLTLLNQSLIDLTNNSDKKYDYIVITTSMPRLEKFVLETKKQTAFLKLLDISYRFLNDNGVILFAIDNKFSIKNFSGASSHSANSYDVLTGKLKNTDIYSKREIIELIQNSKFENYKFYYPFPDYKLPSVIYSDEYLPNKNSSKLKYLIYYNPEDTIVFNETEVLKEVIKDGMLDYFANSYIIEIAKNKDDFCKAKFVSFNNFRKKENKMITKIYDEYVEKTNIFDTGKEHIANIKNYIDILNKSGFKVIDEVKGNKIYSKFQKLENLSDILSEYILNDEIDIALEIISNWYKYIKDKFDIMIIDNKKILSNSTVFEKYEIQIPVDLKEKLTFLEYGFFDIIFENIFAKLDDKNNFESFLIYDQEWCEENLPIEYILYRALNNLFYYNSKISKYIQIEELYKKFEIEEFIIYFKSLEEKIQNTLLDSDIAKEYQNTYVALTTLEAMQEIIYYSRNELEDIKGQYTAFIKHVEHTNNEWQKALDDANNKIAILEKKLNSQNNIKNRIKKIFRK